MQEDILQGRQADAQTGNGKVNGQVFHQIAENDCRDIMHVGANPLRIERRDN
jgi:hypothetical protein